MRELKFRVWDTRRAAYPSMTYGWMVDNGKPCWWDSDHGRLVYEDLPLMQYIGLKDRNGKDVYEGDIVLLPNGPEVVTYGLEDDKFAGFWPFAGGYDYAVWDSGASEVIGNIYENPELLPAKT